MTDEKPTILVFKSSDPAPNDDNDIVQNLREKANVYEVDDEKSYGYAKLLSNHPSAQAIFILKSDILAPIFEHLWDQMSDYVRGGGIVVLSRSFVNASQRPDLNGWMIKTWGLPWEFRPSATSDTAVLKRYGVVRPREWWRNGLPATCNFSQGSTLISVPQSDSWYSSVRRGPMSINIRGSTSVAFGKVGLGWLGYAGDINNSDGRTAVVLAMMGLNEEGEPCRCRWLDFL